MGLFNKQPYDGVDARTLGAEFVVAQNMTDRIAGDGEKKKGFARAALAHYVPGMVDGEPTMILEPVKLRRGDDAGFLASTQEAAQTALDANGIPFDVYHAELHRRPDGVHDVTLFFKQDSSRASS